MNCSFALDGDSSKVFTYSWQKRCFDVPGPTGCYNTSVYNNPSLAYGAHTLNITLLSYVAPDADLFGTEFILDYVVISGEDVGLLRLQSQYVSFLPGLRGADITQYALSCYCCRSSWRWNSHRFASCVLQSTKRSNTPETSHPDRP